MDFRRLPARARCWQGDPVAEPAALDPAAHWSAVHASCRKSRSARSLVCPICLLIHLLGAHREWQTQRPLDHSLRAAAGSAFIPAPGCAPCREDASDSVHGATQHSMSNPLLPQRKVSSAAAFAQGRRSEATACAKPPRCIARVRPLLRSKSLSALATVAASTVPLMQEVCVRRRMCGATPPCVMHAPAQLRMFFDTRPSRGCDEGRLDDWMFTQRSILQRESARLDPLVQRQLARWFLAADADGDGLVCWEEYRAVGLRLVCVLSDGRDEAWTAEEAAALVEEDWRRDLARSCVTDALTRHAFCVSIFQVCALHRAGVHCEGRLMSCTAGRPLDGSAERAGVQRLSLPAIPLGVCGGPCRAQRLCRACRQHWRSGERARLERAGGRAMCVCLAARMPCMRRRRMRGAGRVCRCAGRCGGGSTGRVFWRSGHCW